MLPGREVCSQLPDPSRITSYNVCYTKLLRAGLLQKPIVKNALALAGDGLLAQEHLDLQWPLSLETYVLTLARWGEGAGSWEQTSRPGSNLVLQLNFSRGHDRAYDRFLKPDSEGPFTCGNHPVHNGGRHTLA